MRVLHLYSGNLYGGVETVLVSLARQRGLCPTMEPHFALCFEGRLRDELLACDAPVYLLGNVRISRPWTVWQARRRLQELLRQTAFDVVICHSCWPHVLFAPVVRQCKVPLVFSVHDMPTGYTWLEWWAGHTRPDLVLVNSKQTQAELDCLFPDSPSVVVYNPLPAPTLPDTATIRRQRAAMQTADDAVVLIQVCRLERWKGHHLLLDALAQLTDLPDWLCWFVGGAQRPCEQAYLEELQEKVRRLGLAERVRFLGQRTDVPQLLAAADIHCQPNLTPEPFGNVFIEALYASLPVVSTAMGGPLEIVDETCGVLVPPANPESLTEALAELIRDKELRRRLGSAGPQRARQLCEPGRQLGQLHGYLMGLAERGTV